MLSFMTHRRTRFAAIGLSFAAMLLLSGCACWFMPCDRVFRLSGHVLELDGRPVNGATVELYSARTHSCADGCFYLPVVPAASGFELVVSKEGYRSYTRTWRAGDYDVTVHLAPASGTADSSATWKDVAAVVRPACAAVDCK
jgi:Carboxypeptidase regulatory-like domain